MIQLRKMLAYQLPKQWMPLEYNFSDYEWQKSDAQTIIKFFENDPKRLSAFSKFLRRGCLGIVWHNGREWIAYAWMSLPETCAPPHLPQWIRRLPVYWIFFCRTKDKYQGQGLYKASLSLLARWARERDPKAEVYIDTEPYNIPSRRAIEAVGFSPRGIITTWTLRVPKLSLVLWGRWDQDAPHPEVGE